MISEFTEITAKTVNTDWVQMWLLAGALFLLAKLAVLRRHQTAVTLADKLVFTLLWPGMDLPAFTRRIPPDTNNTTTLLRRGLINLTLGAALTWVIAHHIPHTFAATWLCMIGFIWALHGGVFTLVTAFWRRRGRDVQPLMNAPLLAASVTEFWGKRWNHAFRDLAHETIFKPATRRLGAKAALVLVFLASGLIHELIVTVPAHGGYGGPTLYFALQAVGLLLECGCPLKSQFIWRARALAFVILPLPVAFPPAFVTRVCEPFFTALGAL